MKSIILLIIAISLHSTNAIAQDYTDPIVSEDVVFQEKEGIVAVEAEYFFKQTKREG